MDNNTARPLLVTLGVWGIKTRGTMLAFLYMDLRRHCHCIGDSSLLDRASDASRSRMVLVCDALDGPARRLEMTYAHFH